MGTTPKALTRAAHSGHLKLDRGSSFFDPRERLGATRSDDPLLGGYVDPPTTRSASLTKRLASYAQPVDKLWTTWG